jgi:uncharacterized protein (UPF0276 family)
MTARSLVCSEAGVGIGLRQPHYDQALDERADCAFVEVHSENFFAEGGATLAVLARARELSDVSLHGVGLGLGSAAGLDAWHLERLVQLVDRCSPVRVSDHACFARVWRPDSGHVVHANDLLPVAFTPASLDILVRNVTQVQERLRRAILVENLSAYVSFDDDVMNEPDFLVELCRRAGCGLLLDVNNLMVNALNAGAPDPLVHCCAAIDALARAPVGEIHLAGFADVDGLAIDDHGSRVRPLVWQAFRHALQRLGRVPALIEWDTDLPAFETLLGEAQCAALVMAEVSQLPSGPRHAVSPSA